MLQSKLLCWFDSTPPGRSRATVKKWAKTTTVLRTLKHQNFKLKERVLEQQKSLRSEHAGMFYSENNHFNGYIFFLFILKPCKGIVSRSLSLFYIKWRTSYYQLGWRIMNEWWTHVAFTCLKSIISSKNLCLHYRLKIDNVSLFSLWNSCYNYGNNWKNINLFCCHFDVIYVHNVFCRKSLTYWFPICRL
jgi:hypothetical protein